MSINYTTLLTGALSFTIALAWNEAINKTIRSLYPPSTDEKQNVRITIAYALVITVLVVIIVALINHTRKFVHRAIGYEPRPERLAAEPDPEAQKPCQSGGCGGSPTKPSQGATGGYIVKLWTPR
jgi:hypothetical protein